MSIQQLIDEKLIAEEAAKQQRVRSGKFSPSSFGRCYRYQYWNRQNVPVTNPVSVEALRRFKVGTLIHNYAQQCFPTAACEVEITDGDDLIGYADIVLPDEVIDIKSCRTFEYKKLCKADCDISAEKYQNCLQVATYGLFLHKPIATLMFIEKDALDSVEFNLVVNDWKTAIADELEILRGHWKNGQLPAPSPRAYGGRECQYCSFMNKCFEMQGKPLEEDK